MTKKIDKIRRQQTLLSQLNNDTYDKETFMSTFHVRDRTIRRDLNELAEQGDIFEERLNLLRKQCLGKLTKKVFNDELPPHLMVQLALSGVPHRMESNETIDVTTRHIIVKMWKPEDEPTN